MRVGFPGFKFNSIKGEKSSSFHVSLPQRTRPALCFLRTESLTGVLMRKGQRSTQNIVILRPDRMANCGDKTRFKTKINQGRKAGKGAVKPLFQAKAL